MAEGAGEGEGTAMTEAPTKIERNTSGIRDVLFDQIDRLRNGDCDVGEAKAVAALVGQIIASVNMDIAVAKLRADYPGDTKLDLPSPLKLEKK